MSMFTAPAQSSGFTPADHLGHLLIVEVKSYEASIITSLGEKDAVSATIHDVDTGETAEDALIFPKVLVGSLKGRIGQTVLATLTQGQAKPGQSAPWTLTDATGNAADVARATAFMNARAAGQYVPPAPAVAQPVAAAPVAAMSPEVAAARALLEAQGLA
jgi:hypothetical protein